MIISKPAIINQIVPIIFQAYLDRYVIEIGKYKVHFQILYRSLNWKLFPISLHPKLLSSKIFRCAGFAIKRAYNKVCIKIYLLRTLPFFQNCRLCPTAVLRLVNSAAPFWYYRNMDNIRLYITMIGSGVVFTKLTGRLSAQSKHQRFCLQFLSTLWYPPQLRYSQHPPRK